MKIENQVCSLEQAKQLKELGVCQDSLFSWFGDEKPRLLDNGATGAEYGPWIFISQTDPVNNQESDWRADVCCTNPIAAAFTAAELGAMLPSHINEMRLTQWPISYTIGIGNMSYGIQYRYRPGSIHQVIPSHPAYGQSEAEARAKLLISIIEGKSITAEEVNQRLQAA